MFATCWRQVKFKCDLGNQVVQGYEITFDSNILLALIFTRFQGMEYVEAPFTISDGIYGSTFFLTTGFHGFHVIIGTIFLIICAIRQYLGHFTQTHHFGFEVVAWYWHFVDVVWLFLFVSIYWWGSN
jgi:cytochrome c oxidase subunit 3